MDDSFLYNCKRWEATFPMGREGMGSYLSCILYCLLTFKSLLKTIVVVCVENFFKFLLFLCSNYTIILYSKLFIYSLFLFIYFS